MEFVEVIFPHRRFRALAQALLVSVTLLVSMTALAGDKAIAESLFNEAKALRERGEIAAACKTFAASMDQDRSAGTALNLAKCHADLGQTATAWSRFREAIGIAQLQGRADAEKIAIAEAARLEAVLTYLVVEVSEPVEGQKVFRNGVELPEVAWGTRVPVDPGPVEITAEAPGHESLARKLELPKGPAEEKVTLSALTPAQALRAPVDEETPAVRKMDAPEDEPERAQMEMVPNRKPGYIVGGIGVGVVGVGLLFGLFSKDTYEEAKDLCGGKTRGCPKEALSKRNGADALANVSNVLVGVGAVGAIVGTYLLIKAPKKERPIASISVDPLVGTSLAGALISGSF